MSLNLATFVTIKLTIKNPKRYIFVTYGWPLFFYPRGRDFALLDVCDVCDFVKVSFATFATFATLPRFFLDGLL
jgi:hypothetical protein